MPEQTKKLILIDANALMHRAYHALPPLTTKKGELVNAVYGFTSVLLKVIKELKPDYMICAFDVAGKTFRDKIYEDYKAGRVKPEQEFYDQIPRIKEVVRTLNIPIAEKQGFEADDIIGSLAKQATSKFNVQNSSQGRSESPRLKIVIVTGDLDTLQLVDENTEVYTLRRGIKDTVVYDRKAVMERYGLKPEQIVDFKGLRGDPSDNIPGVKGIGEKGAIELLKNFGSIENLYKAIEENRTRGLIKPKTEKILIEQKDKAFLSKKLAAIRRDVDIKLDFEKSAWGNYDKEKLNKLFRELEFYSLLDRIDKVDKKTKSSSCSFLAGQASETEIQSGKDSGIECAVLDSKEKLDEFLTKIKRQKQFVFRTIRESDDAFDKNLTALVFCWEGSPIYYIPLAAFANLQNLSGISAPGANSKIGSNDGSGSNLHQPVFQGRLFDEYRKEENQENYALKSLKPILEDEKYKKIGYFLGQDLRALRIYGIDIKGIDFDIAIAAYLLDPGKKNYSEEKIIFDYLEGKEPEQIANKKEIEEKTKCADEVAKVGAFLTLSEKLKENLKRTKMADLFYKIEMPLIKVLVKMETNGVKLDVKLFERLSDELEEKISQLDYKIHKLAGDRSFNINSSQQLAYVLFEKMGLPATDIKKTQTGYSTAAAELDKLRDKHIIIDFISQYRELVKLKNTYVDALPKLVDKKTGRLHTTFHQTATATGRLSSSNPNLQNIPVRTDFGRKIRKGFIAERGRKLLSADYSQIELRIVAVIADDREMKKIFAKGLDIHSATAAEINRIPIEKVTPQMRRAAKALNFGVIYGMSAFGFAKAAGIDQDRAKEFIDSYMKKFSKVAEYIERSKKEAREKGFAQTIWGRRRYLPELNSPNKVIRSAAERMAINMPIQGTAADIIKIAMINVDRWIESYNNKNEDSVRLLLQVHDELLFSVKEENVKEAAENIKKIMENGHLKVDGRKMDFTVPIKVDVKVGDNWEEMASYD